MLGIQRCLIVGAGISGLLLARRLQEGGFTVTILEKSRGVGGRMATRRHGQAIFDHGAQFMTTRERRFREMVEGWLADGLVRPWYRGPLGNMRYVGLEGMTQVPKVLARGLDIHLQTLVTGLHLENGHWTVTARHEDSGEETRHVADLLVLTPPVPQTLDLLATSNVELDYDEEEDLRRITYLKCLTVLVQLEGPAGLPAPGAMDLNHDVLRWIGDNSVKGVSPIGGTLTLNSSARFAEAQWDAPDSTRLPLLLNAAKPFLKVNIKDASLHRWRYSEPTRLYKEKQPFRQPFFLDEERRIAMCGDGFAGGRIEAAALSGLALADALLRPY